MNEKWEQIFEDLSPVRSAPKWPLITVVILLAIGAVNYYGIEIDFYGKQAGKFIINHILVFGWGFTVVGLVGIVVWVRKMMWG